MMLSLTNLVDFLDRKTDGFLAVMAVTRRSEKLYSLESDV
jgi:hypothetical protein